MTSRLQVEHLVKEFNGNRALDDVSLSIEAGRVHGLIGQNGAGKSTLINVICGIYQPDGGRILVDGKPVHIASPADAFALGIRVVHQELVAAPKLTIAQTLLLGHEHAFGGLHGRGLTRAIDERIAEKLGVRLDSTRLMESLTPAETKLVQIARAIIYGTVRILILDEPTAPLSREESELVFRAVRTLRDSSASVIYVSHYLGEVLDLADAITVFRNGKVVADESDLSGMTGERLVELMVGRPVGELFPDFKPVDAAQPVKFAVRGLSGRTFHDCTFAVRPGEVLGVGGITGSGREELIDAIYGAARPLTGTIELKGRTIRPGSVHRSVAHGIARVPRDRRATGFVRDLSVRDNLALPRLSQFSKLGVLDFASIRKAADRIITRLHIRPDDPTTPTRLLSGGNQQKVAIGGWIGSGATVLLLEDPTVGIDVGARADIYRTLKELTDSGVSIIVSGNDFNELAGLCHRVVMLKRGRIVAEVSGDGLNESNLLRIATDADGSDAGSTDASAGNADAVNTGEAAPAQSSQSQSQSSQSPQSQPSQSAKEERA